MDFSAANTGLWNIIIQLGIVAAVILFSNFLRRKIPFIRDSLLPTAVLGGFILFILRHVGLLKLDVNLMEILVYHCIALGFIAMSLRISSDGAKSGGLVGAKSGATIVGTYLIQAIAGLIITIALAYTLKPDLFKASGILLPMGYGQGPGQANNLGTTYEGLGFTGGRSFGLAIAAAGYLCACIVGVIMLNVYAKKGKLSRSRRDEVSGSVTVDHFQDKNEIPIAESVDRFSVQIAMVLLVYLVTYLVTWGITVGIGALAPGLGKTVNSLLWGFNFIIGSALAILAKVLLMPPEKKEGKTGLWPKLKLIISPPLVAVFVGLALSACNVKLPVVIQYGLDKLGGMAATLGILQCGATLGSYPVRRMVSWPAAGLTVLRNLLMPALVFLVCRLIGLPEMYTQLAVIYSALPVASLTSTYVVQYDPDPEHHLIGAGFVFLSTLLCAATLTLFLNLL